MTSRAKSIVPKIGEPDIDESYIRQRDAVLLETLLIDRTMTAVNDGLALALSYMKEVEGWGGGVARYFTDWTAAGLPRPRLEETPGFFKVVFERKKTLDESPNEPLNEPLNETVNEPVKMAVIEAVRKMPGVRRPALMRIVGKSRATLTRILSELVAQRLVEHRGSDKTGGYFPAASAQKEAK